MSGEAAQPDDLPNLSPSPNPHGSHSRPARKADRPLTNTVGVQLDRELYVRLRNYSILKQESMSNLCRRGLLIVLAEGELTES